jgi:hypothetical protein
VFRNFIRSLKQSDSLPLISLYQAPAIDDGLKNDEGEDISPGEARPDFPVLQAEERARLKIDIDERPFLRSNPPRRSIFAC